jgi:ABC-2 type transport system permease protein
VFLIVELPVELHLVKSSVLIISPFVYVPRLPAAQLTVAPLVGLVGVAAVLLLIGLIGFRRRDVG